MAISNIADRAGPKARKGPPCSVCTLLDRLPDAEREALLQLLRDPEWRYADIARELMTEGYDLSAYTLGHHARGDCAARTKLR